MLCSRKVEREVEVRVSGGHARFGVDGDLIWHESRDNRRKKKYAQLH